MQRILIVLVVGLLVAGCGEVKEELTLEEQKALRDSVVGEYELNVLIGIARGVHKEVFLESGVYEHYVNGKIQQMPIPWSIVNGEIHVVHVSGTGVLRINTDKSITCIAHIEDGKRIGVKKGIQHTFKKIK